MKWIKSELRKPAKGSLVIVKTRRATCSCSGYDEREVYFDGYFHGIRNQGWIKAWAYSPNNDILCQLEKEAVVPAPCKNCIDATN